MSAYQNLAARIAGTAAAIVLACSPAVRAQRPVLDSSGTVVSGVVYDSVQAGAIAGAAVQLISETNPATAFTATSDSAGRYRIAHVPPGKYVIGFLDPSLGELGLSAVQRRIIVASTPLPNEVLATPSPATIRATICGRMPGGDSSGVLMGFVRDADSGVPIGLTTVVATWQEFTIGKGGVKRDRRQVPAKADSVGWFAICGLPEGDPIAVRAESGKRATGFIDVTLPPRGVVVRDFDLGTDTVVAGARDSAVSPLGDVIRHGTSRVLGTVADSTGRMLAGAHLTVWGAGVGGVTDDAGRFDLGRLPAGTQTLEVLHLGLQPLRVVISLRTQHPDTVHLIMEHAVPVLAAVNVYGKPKRISTFDEFLERARTGLGRYYTADQITKTRPFQLTDFFYTVPGVRVEPTSNFDYALVATRSGSACSPTVFVDGNPIPKDVSINTAVRPEEVAGMEVYADGATVPAQYRRGDNKADCGAILIWTR